MNIFQGEFILTILLVNTFMRRRPFHSSYHTTSAIGMVGGVRRYGHMAVSD